MIRYIDDKNKTRQLFEEIFPEDSKEFLDYYYTYRTATNKVLCKYENDNIISMLHLNFYSLYINNTIYKTYYIVAVATLESYRKKGYMSSLLKNAMKDMYKEDVPFTFLRPAKDEIYLPFDFTYIYNHNELGLNALKDIKEVYVTENDIYDICNFTNKFLSKKYNTFVKRDSLYFSNLLAEVKSENGNIIKFMRNNKLLGYYVYWGTNEKIVRAIFDYNDLSYIKDTKKLVMARIINLEKIFESIKKDNDLYLYINITDNIIKENNGLFILDKYGIKKTNESNLNTLNIDISNLTSVCFGYEDISVFTKNEFIINMFKNITFLNVFLDEEV